MRSSSLDTFTESAAAWGISEYTVSDVGLSPGFAVKERKRLYRGTEYNPDLLARVKVEFAVFDEQVQRLAQEVLTLISPDSIAISPLEEVISMSSIAGHRVPRSRTEQRSSEVVTVMHH